MITVNEIWVNIIDYEEEYKISNYGRVLSLPKQVGKRYRNESIILKQSISKDDFMFVNLSKNKIKKPKYIHRLVAKHFLKSPKRKKDINVIHKDGNLKNNYVNNLKYITKNVLTKNIFVRNKYIKANKHILRVKKKEFRELEYNSSIKGELNFSSKLISNQVLEIRKLYIEKKYTQLQLAKIYNVSTSLISAIIIRKSWKHI